MKFRGHLGIKTALFVAAAIAALVLAVPEKSEAAVKCGVVEKLTRTVTVQREGQQSELQEGSEVYNGDVIKSGLEGYAEIKLIDDTLIAMGANSIVALTEVQFNVGKSQLHMSVDYGAVWVSTGSIGLKNAEAVSISTPSSKVSSGNATLQFMVGSGVEELKVQWIPKGGKVSVFNTRSKQRAELRETDVTLSINAMTVTSGDVEEAFPEEEIEK